MKSGRTHWSRSRRDPSNLEGVTGAQSVLFPAGADLTISLVSVREALLCTWYVRTGLILTLSLCLS